MKSKCFICLQKTFSRATFYFQLSFGVSSIGPGMVHSNVIKSRLLDDEGVLLSILLEAIFLGFLVSVKLLILKEPGKGYHCLFAVCLNSNHEFESGNLLKCV